MDAFSPPQEFQAQKEWAETLDIKGLDAEYHRGRKLAVRRAIFAAIDRAFDEIPEMEIVTFSFNYNKKSIKDSINAYAGNLNAAEDKKVNDKFNKLMSSVRARVGQDTSTWESLGSFFNGGNRRLMRGSHSYFIEQIFDEKTTYWNDDAEAKWQAGLLDLQTPAATSRHSGPRL